MKLLLTSGGITNRSIAKALRGMLIRPIKESKLVFIPTAANTVAEDKSWLINDLKNCQALKFKEIDIVDIAALSKKHWEPRLKKADVLVFGGGNTFDLMYWLEKTGLKKMLPNLLKRRVYVGISAGSIAASPSLMLSHVKQLYYEGAGRYTNKRGLGLVNFQVRPHFGSPDFPKARVKYLKEMARETADVTYALDDNSAVKVEGNEVEVISEGKWKRFN